VRRFALIALMLALTPHSARAYTRFAFQNSSGAVIEFGFSAMTIPFQIDAGGTGVAGADAQTLIATAFSLWNNVATSDLNLTISGNTSADITATNVRTVLDPFLGPQLDGLDPTTNEVILDADGSILNQFYGGTPGLLGIAFPQTDEATGRIKTTNTVIFVTNNRRGAESIHLGGNPRDRPLRRLRAFDDGARRSGVGNRQDREYVPLHL
jgi:hypothetical protein